MKITWMGHASFRMEIGNQVLLIDPWVTGNPVFPADQRATALSGATHILITHGHGDHTADAVAMSKGLGAPIGAVLAGSQSFVDQARRYKQAFGGAMRQAGIAAAGCLHALEHHIERLAEDHRNARVLAQALAGMPGVVVTNPQPETNMVFFRVDPGLISHGELIDTLAQRGVALGDAGAEIRAVTHLDVTSETLALAVDKIRDVLTAAEARVA